MTYFRGGCLFDCLGFFNVPILKQWGAEVRDILNEAYSELLPHCPGTGKWFVT